MITYEEIKIWISEKDNQKFLTSLGCIFVAFLVGFGAGSFVKQNKQKSVKTYNNYTTQSPKKPAELKAGAGEGGIDKKAVQGVVASSTDASCLIKGNISSGDKKIYHVPGGAYYKKVKAEMCFSTEAEAKAAGFVKSGR